MKKYTFLKVLFIVGLFLISCRDDDDIERLRASLVITPEQGVENFIDEIRNSKIRAINELNEEEEESLESFLVSDVESVNGKWNVIGLILRSEENYIEEDSINTLRFFFPAANLDLKKTTGIIFKDNSLGLFNDINEEPLYEFNFESFKKGENKVNGLFNVDLGEQSLDERITNSKVVFFISKEGLLIIGQVFNRINPIIYVLEKIIEEEEVPSEETPEEEEPSEETPEEEEPSEETPEEEVPSEETPEEEEPSEETPEEEEPSEETPEEEEPSEEAPEEEVPSEETPEEEEPSEETPEEEEPSEETPEEEPSEETPEEEEPSEETPEEEVPSEETPEEEEPSEETPEEEVPSEETPEEEVPSEETPEEEVPSEETPEEEEPSEETPEEEVVTDLDERTLVFNLLDVMGRWKVDQKRENSNSTSISAFNGDDLLFPSPTREQLINDIIPPLAGLGTNLNIIEFKSMRVLELFVDNALSEDYTVIESSRGAFKVEVKEGTFSTFTLRLSADKSKLYFKQVATNEEFIFNKI